jgi:hypothetical protein
VGGCRLEGQRGQPDGLRLGSGPRGDRGLELRKRLARQRERHGELKESTLGQLFGIGGILELVPHEVELGLALAVGHHALGQARLTGRVIPLIGLEGVANDSESVRHVAQFDWDLVDDVLGGQAGLRLRRSWTHDQSEGKSQEGGSPVSAPSGSRSRYDHGLISFIACGVGSTLRRRG